MGCPPRRITRRPPRGADTRLGRAHRIASSRALATPQSAVGAGGLPPRNPPAAPARLRRPAARGPRARALPAASRSFLNVAPARRRNALGHALACQWRNVGPDAVIALLP